MRRFLVALAVVAGTFVPAIAASPASAAPATESPSAPTTSDAPAAATGGIGIRLVDAPVDARDDPRARVYIVDHLNLDTVIHRRIEVSNGTADPATVSLYSAAATITDGSFLGSAGHTPNELSTWTSIDPASVDLAPGAKQMVTVTVSVPKDAAPGEQYGVVWAEVSSAPAAGAGVTQVSRVGIRLYISVGPGGAPAANFTIDTLTAERAPDGRPMVSAAVHNTGGRALDLNGTLQLSAGPGGLNAGPFPVSTGTTVALNTTEPATIMLDNSLPAGPWTAEITMKSGLLEVKQQATITFPDTGTAQPVAAEPLASNVPGWLYPALIGLAVLLLAVVALLVLTLRRRGSAR